MNDFGMPNAGDPTSELEKDVDALAKWGNEEVDAIVERVLPRSIGSVDISMDDQIMDYEAILADPSVGAQRIQERAAQVGREQAKSEFIDWAKRVQRVRGSRNGS